MRIVSCLVILACVIASSPAWAADPTPAVALADPDLSFRTPAGEAQAVSARASGPSSLPAENPRSLAPVVMTGTRLLDSTQFAANEASPMQVAQAGGTAGAAPAPTPVGNPWIFGATLYAWIPFATSDSTIDGLPPGSSSWPQSDVTLMNIYAGAGEFQLSKGDWGLFGNVAGSSIGLKGVILQEDPLHPNRTDRSGYSYSSVVSGQYGLSYRLLGRPLDLAAWARAKQPIALDLLAGGQTFYFATSFSSEREHVSVSTTLTSPLVGTRLSWDLADRWNLGLGGSIGGFGVSDTHLTWQANLTIAYRFRMGDVPGAVTFGFRAQGMNFETGSNENYLKVDEILYGPLLGFSMYF